jgi:tetratricopeptide (TPR) repeat protein
LKGLAPRGVLVWSLWGLWSWLVAAPALALPDTDDWIRLQTANFTVFSNAEVAASERFVADLEVLRAVLERYLEGATVDSPLPTYLYIFRDEEAFEPYKQRVTGSPEEVSGFFAGHPYGNYVAVDGDLRREPRRIIYHEYLHYFVRLNLPGLPLWLNEGLAEYYSTFTVVGEEARVGLPVETHVRYLQAGSMLPLERLLAVDTTSPAYNEGDRRGAFYASAWALAHYLLSDPERYQQLMDFLDLQEAEVPLREAFDQAFGVAFSTLEKAVTRYAAGPHFRYTPLDLTAGELAVPGAPEVRPMSRAEVYFHLGDLLAHIGTGREAEAASHFGAALGADPHLGLAYTGLGFLEAQAGSHGEALAYFEQALQRGGDDFLTYFLYGWSLLRSLGLADGFFSLELEERERATIGQAEAAFERSLQRNPAFAQALAGLGAALTFQEEPSARAVEVLQRALHFLPDRVDVAFNLMVVLARRGQGEAAREVLDRHIAPRAPEEVVSQARDSLRLAQLAAADRLAAAGDLERAVALVEQILAGLEDADAAAQVEFQLQEMRRVLAHNRFADRYNEAVTLANARKTAEAIAVLESLLDERPPPALRRAAEGLLAQLRQRL